MKRMSKSFRYSSSTSWTAIALSALLPLCANASALAQTRDQKQIDELVRKAGTKEAANDFCAHADWPKGDPPGTNAIFTSFLKSAKIGSWNIAIFSNGTCVFNRVTDVHEEDGGKCVGYAFYFCPKSGSCDFGKSIDCLDRNGAFASRRDG